MLLDRCKERLAGAANCWCNSLAGHKTVNVLIIALVALFILVNVVLGIYWSREPDLLNVRQEAAQKAQQLDCEVVPGFISTTTAIRIGETLLDKPGGYLRNDIMPPGVLLDNMPNWELGVLIQLRDFTRALRQEFSRSQSQSQEDVDLVIAEPQFNFDSDSWALPSSEGEYRRGIKHLDNYLRRLSDPDDPARFYSRADNLMDWLKDVGTRLGSLSQRLSASVGKVRLNTDMVGDVGAVQSISGESAVIIKTPWHRIDDIFYEARGTSWALIALLSAVEVDFADVLKKKNARISLRQIIRELRETQEPLGSPVILNGNGFGMLANHSLVMANYISRANAAIIDLRRLLEQG